MKWIENTWNKIINWLGNAEPFVNFRRSKTIQKSSGNSVEVLATGITYKFFRAFLKVFIQTMWESIRRRWNTTFAEIYGVLDGTGGRSKLNNDSTIFKI